MDIGLREWLVVIGIIVIAAVLFDGWRRMSGSRNTLKFRLDRNLADLPEEENPEIIGPARVVKKKEPSLSSRDDFELDLHAESDQRLSTNHEAVQGALKLDEPQISNELDSFEQEDEPVLSAEDEDDSAGYEEILIIHVVARSEEGFKGSAADPVSGNGAGSGAHRFFELLFRFGLCPGRSFLDGGRNAAGTAGPGGKGGDGSPCRGRRRPGVCDFYLIF